ncbi:MAG: hypothetical protein ACXQS6_01370 [Candidatus Syntropharchaeales archaeon]
MVLYSYLSDLITLKVLNIAIIVLGIILFLGFIRINSRESRKVRIIGDKETGASRSNQWEKRLDEISEAYGLESLTITTRDGFVVLSSSPTAEFDAANFSSLYVSMAENDETATGKGITALATDNGVAWVAPLDGLGEADALCVMRSETGVKKKTALKVKDETEKIMEHLFTAS